MEVWDPGGWEASSGYLRGTTDKRGLGVQGFLMILMRGSRGPGVLDDSNEGVQGFLMILMRGSRGPGVLDDSNDGAWGSNNCSGGLDYVSLSICRSDD